ncbi:ATP-binding protein [Jiella avicenniae]|uniref:histidine kinase n=1 Tax=Jiella avicenniae TaxID=2907202 RepID=A0A9X1NZ82_9HYPH|nr:ATP-binding protein [Jiella avicenniae]MCE7027076.1 ATP-binding protein [Jiella avicenniae]
MATTFMRQTLAIMANPAVRGANAAETAVLVLSSDLSRLLWANAAGAQSFGLSSPGPQRAADGRPRVLAQLSGSSGILSRKGRTSLLLRIHQGVRATNLSAELRRLAVEDGGIGDGEDHALLTVSAVRPAYRPQDRDGALVREAGLSDEHEVRLVPLDAATSLAPDDDLPAAQAIAAFIAGGKAIAEVGTTSGRSLLLARIADDRMVVAPGKDTAQIASEPEFEPSPATPPLAENAPSSPQHPARFRSNWASAGSTATPAAVPASPDDADRSSTGSTEELFDDASPAEAAAPPPAGLDLATEGSTAAAGNEPHGPAEREAGASPPFETASDPRPLRRHSIWNVAAPAGGKVTAQPVSAETPQPTAPDTSRTDPTGPEAQDSHASRGGVSEGDRRPDISSSEDRTSGEDGLSSPDGRFHGEDEIALVETAIDEPDTGPDARAETDSVPQDEAAPMISGHPCEPVAAPGAVDGPPRADDDSANAGEHVEPPAQDVRPAKASDFAASGAGGQTAPSSPFHARTGGDPVRFVWRIDSEGRFRSLSPEFADAVGPASAAVLDRSVDEVARAYRLDGDGALRRLLSRRDTWSGRTVMWPLEGTAKKVPVDLAALPIYARDRSFDGFRGFGVVRLADAVEDADAIGLSPAAALRDVPPADPSEGEQADTALEDSLPAFMRSIGAAAPPINFGRRDPESRPPSPAPEQPARSDEPRERSADKVIRLEERRRAPNAGLSQSEEAAFRAIGETLAQDGSQPHDLAEAVTAASKRIGAIEEARQADGDTADPDAARNDPRAAGSIDPDFAAALERAYGTLPMPILAQTGQELVYANREFLDLAGYADLAALKSAGGFESLIVDRQEGDADFLRLRRSNGQTLAIRARMQRTSVDGTSCLLFAFFATPRLSLVLREIVETSEAQTPGVARGVLEDPLLGLAADGIVLVDEDGLVTAMSEPAQQLFDIPPADISGRPFVTLFAHESQKAIKSLMSGPEDGGFAAAESRTGPGDKWFARRDVIGRVAGGEFLPLSVSLGRAPGTTGFCAVINDITPWKRAEETALRDRASAQASNLQKSTFLGEVAQEIKDPIDAMIGFADLIGTESLGPVGNERYLEYLDDIKRSGHQVIDLVTILHDLAKVESGRQELSFEAVSLAEIVTEVTAVMAPQANRQRVIMRTHMPSSVPPVVGDRHTIRQIATNLVANSIRSTPAGGQLIVSLRHEDETGVSLRFRDSGVAMRQDEIDSALHGPGTGYASTGAETGRLGLPLTKALAEANRAELSISSTPGEGTLVEVRFPPSRVLLD